MTTLSGNTYSGAVIHMDLSGLEKLMARAPEKADEIVRRIAFRVETSAKKNILSMRAVDTRALYNSVMTNTSKGSGFSEASTAAQALRPDAVTANIPEGQMGQAFVGPAVDYGIWVEFGAHNMAPRPFLTNAIENERAKFEGGSEFAEIFET